MNREARIIPRDVYEGMYLEQGHESIDGYGEKDPPPSHPQMRWNSKEERKVPLVETFGGESKEGIRAACGDMLAYKAAIEEGLSPEEADKKAGGLGKQAVVSPTEGDEPQNTFPEIDDFHVSQEEKVHDYEVERDQITRDVGTHNVTAAPRIQRGDPIRPIEDDPEREAYEEDYLSDAKRAFDGYSEGGKVGRWGSERFSNLSRAEITKASHGGTQ